MTGKLVIESGVFYIKKDGMKYPLTLKCLEIISEIENQSKINLKAPVSFRIVSEDNVKKAEVAAVKVLPLNYVKPNLDSDVEKIHFYISLIQTAILFSEEHNIIREVWTTPYLRALMAETNQELARVASIPFNHVTNAPEAATQFENSTNMVERLFQLSINMSKLDEQSQLKLQSQLDNIFNFYNINPFEK